MSLFHQHQWEERARLYQPPAHGGKVSGRGLDALVACERALHGFTTIELRCTACGVVRIVAHIGDLRTGRFISRQGVRVS